MKSDLSVDTSSIVYFIRGEEFSKISHVSDYSNLLEVAQPRCPLLWNSKPQLVGATLANQSGRRGDQNADSPLATYLA